MQKRQNTKNRFVNGVRIKQEIHYISIWVTFPSEIPPVSVHSETVHLETMYRCRHEHTNPTDFNLNNSYAMNLRIGNPLLQDEDQTIPNPQSL
jgi:hypothetical protein